MIEWLLISHITLIHFSFCRSSSIPHTDRDNRRCLLCGRRTSQEGRQSREADRTHGSEDDGAFWGSADTWWETYQGEFLFFVTLLRCKHMETGLSSWNCCSFIHLFIYYISLSCFPPLCIWNLPSFIYFFIHSFPYNDTAVTHLDDVATWLVRKLCVSACPFYT